MVALQPVEPLPVAPAQVWLRFLGQPEEVVGVAPPQLVDASPDSSSRSTAYSRIVSSIANRGSSSVPSRRISPLVGQRRQAVDDVEVVAADALAPPRSSTPGEHREPQEQALLRRLEEVVAPIDRRAERALALGCVPRASLEQLQRVIEPLAAEPPAAATPTRVAASSIASGSPSSARQIVGDRCAFAP